MKKILILPLTAITIGSYSVLHILFSAAAPGMMAIQVLFGLLLVIVGLCILDEAMDTLKKQEQQDALKKEMDDQAHRELQRKVRQIEREFRP